ncbi:cpl-1 [Symbiodinium sp. KB8]|nr:cpl-1 [Symbiodinium sp. KB8]
MAMWSPVLLLVVGVAAHSGTCPASKKCGADAGSEKGLPCCQISSTSFECCSSSEACIPNVGCRCAGEENLRDYEGYSFEDYKQEFSKSYADHELESRKSIFEANLRKVQAHNAEYRQGHRTWYMAMNELADLSSEEFGVRRSTKVAHAVNRPFLQLDAEVHKPNPAAFDWRSTGVVTPVKDQGGCGSCWAFSATETVESHYAIASGKLLTLAPQTYVDCVENPDDCGGTGGCEGATMELAFNLTISKGIALESSLPYEGRDASCPSYKPAVKAKSYVRLPINEAASLETALATKGPMSVTVAAGSWQLYGGGIFSGCSEGSDNTLDHGVQAVGYAKDYWLIRNSWGPGWGEKGYIRLSRASDTKTFVDHNPADGEACKPYPKTQTIGGECGVLFDSSYPVGLVAGTEEEIVV